MSQQPAAATVTVRRMEEITIECPRSEMDWALSRIHDTGEEWQTVRSGPKPLEFPKVDPSVFQIIARRYLPDAPADPDPTLIRSVMAEAADLLADLSARHDTVTGWEDEPGTIRITAGGYDFIFAVHQPDHCWKDHGYDYSYAPEEDPGEPTIGDYTLDLTPDPQELAAWIRARLRSEGVIPDTCSHPDRA